MSAFALSVTMEVNGEKEGEAGEVGDEDDEGPAIEDSAPVEHIEDSLVRGRFLLGSFSA
jgi:hypothetical protein